ncbi:cupin domain-containing protein [Rhodococcus sp. IEGM 1330]|uniref:cupin domain-containing protein n=1 Tax=Rhodococcus sp. IEGM 1330 TaxID=3082225 RepID=UPI0029551742|nr:cupin domain-containing protein [Rhodococcus sp. IEGM 1330]MDV8021629.1 cupin domain-containing protein [Rhodococcus sp. IEGM 1330]
MRVHRNAAAGETLTVHDTGPLLRAELTIEAVHHAPPAHVHPHSAERFTVIDGVIRLRVGRRKRILTAGDSALVPAGVVHGYEGVPGRTARVNVELDPSGRMAEFFAEIYGIDSTSRNVTTGAPRLRSAAAVLRRYPDDITAAGVPGFLLRLLAARRQTYDPPSFL